MAESMLKDVGIYKESLISNILTDDVLELLLGSDYTEDKVENVVYGQVFPYLYVESIQDKTLSYVCMDVVIEQSSPKIKNVTLVIWAYCHKDVMQYKKSGYRGTRADILADMIDRNIRNLDDFGIGKLDLKKSQYFAPEKLFYGRQLVYTISDFKTKGV